ncbi:MAG: hypothetical protein LWX56_06745 [Ignavibacteria bacterium]|nr:hypothetical protein [Ignavibacteria bacterium]
MLFITAEIIGADTVSSPNCFSRDSLSRVVSVRLHGHIVPGYKTRNRDIVSRILLPWIEEHRAELTHLSPAECINRISLKVFSVYQNQLGKQFYRWGGDILDLDDPQITGVRHKYKYGLDCSGFVTAGYELAVFSKLVKPESPHALFSSMGLRNYSRKHSFRLRGGLKGGNNNYRPDTEELAELGTVVFSIPKGSKPMPAEIEKLQPGDLVGKKGHFGIILFIDEKPYYIESGGFVLPKHNFAPVPAELALTEFAERGSITIRRAARK